MKPTPNIAQPRAQRGSISHDEAAARLFWPRSWNHRTRVRFTSRRRAYWLSRYPGGPTPRQISLVESIAALEWSVARAEYTNTLESLREAREHRRLLDRLVSDFTKSVPVPPRAPTLAEIFGRGEVA